MCFEGCFERCNDLRYLHRGVLYVYTLRIKLLTGQYSVRWSMLTEWWAVSIISSAYDPRVFLKA